MFAFLKAIVLGAVFSFIISGLVGHAGGTGGIANVLHFTFDSVSFYWSWRLFLAGTGLAFVVLLMMD